MVQRIAYSVHEAAEAVGIGLTKLREEIASGNLRARKLGKRTMITIAELNQWLDKMPYLDPTEIHLKEANDH